MEISFSIVVSFVLGLSIGSISVYVHMNKKIQKTKGDKSPNIMGDSNVYNSK
jgi:hypothetical protein